MDVIDVDRVPVKDVSRIHPKNIRQMAQFLGWHFIDVVCRHVALLHGVMLTGWSLTPSAA